MHICDCGEHYSNLDALMACQNNRHYQRDDEDPRDAVIGELRQALRKADNALAALTGSTPKREAERRNAREAVRLALRCDP